MVLAPDLDRPTDSPISSGTYYPTYSPTYSFFNGINEPMDEPESGDTDEPTYEPTYFPTTSDTWEGTFEGTDEGTDPMESGHGGGGSGGGGGGGGGGGEYYVSEMSFPGCSAYKKCDVCEGDCDHDNEVGCPLSKCLVLGRAQTDEMFWRTQSARATWSAFLGVWDNIRPSQAVPEEDMQVSSDKAMRQVE